MREVLTLVLGGGRGTRLYPLTKFRSKPAVPVAGKYRLIDIPLSNCLNSGLNHIYVLTQFNSVSLHRHIRRTYVFDAFCDGFVEILAAQQTLTTEQWYQGTADAVRQNLRHVDQPGIRYVLILSGDQLYRMDFRLMLETHLQTGADVTIGTVPVDREAAPGLGIMRVNEAGRVVGFLEKPKTHEELEHVRTDPQWLKDRGIDGGARQYLASMGIYLFNRNRLFDCLEKTPYQDFGKEVFPAAIRSLRVHVHLFDGYWEDIGTIGSFYQANLRLASQDAPLSLFSPDLPIYTRARFLPPSKIEAVTVRNSLIADGCQIGPGCVIENCVVGLRSIVGRNVILRNTVVMGNDFYTPPSDLGSRDTPPLGIGDESIIDGAIIDKNCHIGRGVRLVNQQGIQEGPENWFGMIRDGVIVIPKGTVLPDGFAL
jgi:glucose-1-phosphate adenylyltransferase